MQESKTLKDGTPTTPAIPSGRDSPSKGTATNPDVASLAVSDMTEDACTAGGEMHLAGSSSASKGPVSSMLALSAVALATPPGPGVLGNTDLSADDQDMPGQGRFLISIVHFYIALINILDSMLAPSVLGLATPPGPGVLGNTDLSADDQDMPGQGRFLISIVHFYIALINILDVHMNSPPPSRFELQGASRTTGGIFRGRAYGNNLNQADFAEEDDLIVPITGKVYLYITAQNPAEWNLATMSRQVIKHEVTDSLAGVLEEIGDRHSPVRRKCELFRNEMYSLLFRQ